MGPKNKHDTEDSLERAPWEDGALTVDVTSVPADVVTRNCLSDDLPIRLAFIKGLAAAATRANRRELAKLLEALLTLLDDEALGVRLETLQQLQQLAKLASVTAAPEEVEEAVVDALEQQIRPSLDPGAGGAGGGARQAGAGTGTLPMVREAMLASLDGVCNAIGPSKTSTLLLRLQRAANAAQDKPGGVGPSGNAGGGGGGGGLGGSKASGDAALMALSLAALSVRHMDPDRGGLAAAAMAGRLSRHGDIRVREAVAAALPQLYGGYAAHPGALEQLMATYDALCNDKVWSVRQACARVAPELSLLCSRCDGGSGDGSGRAGAPDNAGQPGGPQPTPQQQQRADELQVRLLRNLFLDTLLPTKSQWVVTAVRQAAGAAIAALRPGAVSEQLLPPLLDVYCTAVATAVGQGAVEVRRSCAESFADVAAKAGPERWPHPLRPVFTRLLASTDPATLSSLVASAERIARLLAATAPGPSSLDTPASDGGADSGGSTACASSQSQAMAPETTTALYCAAQQVVSGPLLDLLRNQLHLVAPAASGAMAGLLAVSPPGLQWELLQVLPQLCEPPAAVGASGACGTGRCGDWRPRLVLAEHLLAALRAVTAARSSDGVRSSHDDSSDSSSPDTREAAAEAAGVVTRCAVTLCSDPVWAVRRAAAAQVGAMLVAVAEAPPPSPLPAGPRCMTHGSSSVAGDTALPSPAALAESVKGRVEAEDAAASRGERGGGGIGEAGESSGNGINDGGQGSSAGREGTEGGARREEGVAEDVGAPAVVMGANVAVVMDGGAAGPPTGATADGNGASTDRGAGSSGSEQSWGCLTEAQRCWLQHVLQRAEGPTVVGQESGSGREAARAPAPRALPSGAAPEGATGASAAAAVVLVDWLRGALSRGSVAEEALLVACCNGAGAAAAVATVAAT